VRISSFIRISLAFSQDNEGKSKDTLPATKVAPLQGGELLNSFFLIFI